MGEHGPGKHASPCSRARLPEEDLFPEEEIVGGDPAHGLSRISRRVASSCLTLMGLPLKPSNPAAMIRVRSSIITEAVTATTGEALGPSGAVFLTDGYINLAILNWKTEKDADVGPNGPNYNGIHHFGFEVEDLGEACQKLESVKARRLTQKAGLDVPMAPGRHRNFEMKWAGPDDVVFDISHTGWQNTIRIPFSSRTCPIPIQNSQTGCSKSSISSAGSKASSGFGAGDWAGTGPDDTAFLVVVSVVSDAVFGWFADGVVGAARRQHDPDPTARR
jgi:hypothetical protein